MKRIRQASALLALCLSLPALAAVQASINQTRLGPGDELELTLRRDVATDTQPDLRPLLRDFDILATSGGPTGELINGQLSGHTDLVLTLVPKHAGKLQIPPLKWESEQSPALALEVSNSARPAAADKASDSDSGGESFVTAEVDQPQPYVGSTLLLTVRLYATASVRQAGINPPTSKDVQIQPQGSDSQHNETRDGHDYRVVEQHYLLSPQHSGKITLDGPVVQAQVLARPSGNPFDNDPFMNPLFGTLRPLNLQGKPITLDVRPRPTDSTGHDLLPAQALSLEESWKPEGGHIHAGEPLTRHLHLSAAGLGASQLPDLGKLPDLPDGLKAYPDQPRTDTRIKDGQVLGSAEQDIAIIASQPGHYTIPALHLSWWDSKANVQREAVLPARTLEVEPAVGAAASTVASAPAAPPPAANTPGVATPTQTATGNGLPWPWISLALGLLWLLTLVGWWQERRRNRGRVALPATSDTKAPPPPNPAAGKALRAVQQACLSNNPQAARQQLLAWADTQWPEKAPWGLHALGPKLDPALTPLLHALDRACYAGGDWQGAALAKAISLPQVEKAAAKKSALPDLYS